MRTKQWVCSRETKTTEAGCAEARGGDWEKGGTGRSGGGRGGCFEERESCWCCGRGHLAVFVDCFVREVVWTKRKREWNEGLYGCENEALFL